MTYEQQRDELFAKLTSVQQRQLRMLSAKRAVEIATVLVAKAEKEAKKKVYKTASTPEMRRQVRLWYSYGMTLEDIAKQLPDYSLSYLRTVATSGHAEHRVGLPSKQEL